jgi:hypothetical protein
MARLLPVPLRAFHIHVQKPSPLSENASLIALVAANLLPVAGVLLWDWNVFEIVSLYWFENVVIGVFNALKMLMATGEIQPGSQPAGSPKEDPEMPAYLKTPVATGIAGHGIKLFLIPFFTFHYGMFCFVHGIFVVVLLGGRGGGMMKGDPFSGTGTMTARVFDSGGKWFILAIIVSHLFSFLFNYLGKGEYRRTSAPALMAAPYGRIVVLHIAILFGAFVITALGSPVFLLILLITGKIALDVKLHRRSHAKLKAPANS